MRSIIGSARTRRVSVVAVAGLFTLVVAGMLGGAVASADPDPCNDVWQGATPQDPISKVADKTQAYAGQEVTFTINWTPKGDSDTTHLQDCFRVDDGDELLDPLVSVFNYDNEDEPNDGSTTVVITIPNDPDLIGHDIVDRAKITKGAEESRSTFVPVRVIAAPTPPVIIDEEEEEEDDDTDVQSGGTTKKTTKVLGKNLAKTGVDMRLVLLIGIAILALGVWFNQTARDTATDGPSDDTIRAFRARVLTLGRIGGSAPARSERAPPG